MYIVDSSVRVSLFLGNDSMHSIAVEVLNKINDKILLPYCIISEVTTVLTYKHSKKQANLFLEYMSGNKDILLINNEFQKEIHFFKSVSEKISFTDVSVIKLALENNLKLITFDEEMKKLYQKIGK